VNKKITSLVSAMPMPMQAGACWLFCHLNEDNKREDVLSTGTNATTLY
jgi:hypothetical protein